MALPSLTAAERQAYRLTLAEGYTLTTRVRVLNMQGKLVNVLRNRVLDGQVNIDAEADVRRSATVSILDPGKSLSFAPDSPDESSMGPNRLIQIVNTIAGPRIPEGIDIPLITGPIITPRRSGVVVDIEVQNIAALGLLGAAWIPQTWGRGTKKTDVIREILTERMGLTRIKIPDLPGRLGKPLTMHRDDLPWEVATRIAESMNRQLLDQANGAVVLRPWPGRVSWTFRDGGGGLVDSEPVITEDYSQVANAVYIEGGTPRGEAKAVVASAVAPRSHSMAPHRLGYGDAERYQVHWVENDELRCPREARALAKRLLADHLREQITTEYTALPVYHLEPGDLVRLRTGDGLDARHRFRTASIPLAASGSMSVGFLKAVSSGR